MTSAADSGHYSHAFYAAQREGSHSSARIILEELFGLLGRAPDSVVDVGCGVGTWLRAALDLGSRSVRGLDGVWVQPSDLEIPAACFTACDLAGLIPKTVLQHAGRCDLVISLEVAEHLPAASGANFVAALCALSDVVLFSAAIPHQGGANHVNEAWPDHWSALFRTYGFACFDAIRPAVWLRPEVDWWYAQNALVFARGEAAALLGTRRQQVAAPMALVHPRKYLRLVAQGRELGDALAMAVAPPALHARGPDTTAQIAQLERSNALLRAMLASTAEPGAREPAPAMLGALALYDGARDRLYAATHEIARLQGEAAACCSASLMDEVAVAQDQVRLRAAEVVRLEGEVARLRSDAEATRQALDALTGSTTWRATGPLRSMIELARRLARRRPA